ncbi:MAG: hypothetical protein RL033_7281 [Pseudomonadota bacterium]|jgi:hypothetical protein
MSTALLRTAQSTTRGLASAVVDYPSSFSMPCTL